MMSVTHHSHNRSLVWRRKQPSANWVFVGEEAPGQRFVNDHDFRRFSPILLREWSSGAHRDAHRPKIFWTDVISLNNRRISHLNRRTPFYLLKDHANGRPGERKETGQAGGLHTG